MSPGRSEAAPRAQDPGARSVLKAATTEHHARVDQMFSSFDLSDRAGYADFLAAQAGAHLVVEDALQAAGSSALIPDWEGGRRSSLLRADLAALGREPPPPAGRLQFVGPPAVLGGAYVLEGSRLGAAVLRRMVPAELPRTFLSAFEPAAWRRFLAILDEQLDTAEAIAAAAVAACEVFMLFERSGRSNRKATQ